jgi:hypothetical protein
VTRYTNEEVGRILGLAENWLLANADDPSAVVRVTATVRAKMGGQAIAVRVTRAGTSVFVRGVRMGLLYTPTREMLDDTLNRVLVLSPALELAESLE